MITFWRPQDDYGYMSNFAHFGFLHAGIDYATNEHYYQSQKHVGTAIEEAVIRCYSPRDAARMGRATPIDTEAWNKRKLYVMRQGLLFKFTDNKRIGQLLADTRGQMIGEASPYDYYWGLGSKGNGDNWLGKLLMEVRNMIIDWGIVCTRCQRHVYPDSKHVNMYGKECK